MPNHQELAASYQCGLSLSQVASKHNCGITTVARALKATNTPSRPIGSGGLRAISVERDLQIQSLYLAGQTMEEIALNLSIGPATVCRSLVRTKTETRPNSTLRLGESERRCCTCRLVLPITDFNRSKNMPLGRAYDCRKCASRQNMMRFHSVTQDAYDLLFEKQGGVCKICGSIDSRHPAGRLNIDHDHSTGKIRGLLCSHCNRAIGLLGDSAANCLAASYYLRDHGK